MTNEPTNKTDQVRPQEPRAQGGSAGSGSKSTPHPSSLTQGDPARRAFGDKTDDESRRTDPSKVDDKSDKSDFPRPGGQTDEDGGEYDKGPRADAMKRASDNRSQGERSFPSNQQTRPNLPNLPNQPNQKAPQTNVHGKSGSDCSTPVKGPEAKPARTQGGGGTTV